MAGPKEACSKGKAPSTFHMTLSSPFQASSLALHLRVALSLGGGGEQQLDVEQDTALRKPHFAQQLLKLLVLADSQLQDLSWLSGAPAWLPCTRGHLHPYTASSCPCAAVGAHAPPGTTGCWHETTETWPWHKSRDKGPCLLFKLTDRNPSSGRSSRQKKRKQRPARALYHGASS